MQQQIAVNSRAIVLTEIEAMGGAERSMLALSRWLTERELPHHFVMYVDHIGLAQHAAHPIQTVELRPEMRAPKKILALRRYFAQRKSKYKPLMSGYQTILHASLAGERGFHSLMHDTPSLFEDFNALTRRAQLGRFVSDKIAANGMQSGGHTIVTSEYLRDETVRVFGVQADIARMGGFPDSRAFRAREVHGTLRMLSVSRVEANKRIDWILRALAALENDPVPLSSRLDWSFNIAGRGAEMEAMQALAMTLGLSGRVHLHGFVSDEDLQKLYAEAHLFLMPAVQGYGIPAVESLQRGLPVLLHRDSGVSDILLDTPWATVVSGGEADLLVGLRRALDALLRGDQLRAPLPALPTEDSWAEQVATLCAWV